MSLLDWIGKYWLQFLSILGAIYFIANFIKDVFGVPTIGKRIFKGMPVVWKWLWSSAIDRKEMHNKLEEMHRKIDKIVNEVQYNGGTSLKDVVKQTNNQINALMEMQEQLELKVDVNSLRLDTIDIGNDRMTFKLDSKGACIFINEAFLKTFGYTHRDIIGFNWESIIHEDDLEEVQKKWKRAIETQGRYYNEQRIWTSKGELHNCLVVGYPIKIKGQLKEFNGTVDILTKKG